MIPVVEGTLGPHHRNTLVTKFKYANTLRILKKYEEAEKIELERIQAIEELAGPNHEDTLASKNNYATTLRHLLQYKKA